jgi:hypothetical protein
MQGRGEAPSSPYFCADGRLMTAINRHRARFVRPFIAAFVLAVAALTGAAPAGAAIQIESFRFETTDAAGAPTQQAGAHPDQTVNTFIFPKGADEFPLEAPHNIVVDLPQGSVGSPSATATCVEAQLAVNGCSPESQVGVVDLLIPSTFPTPLQFGLFNMKAPPGVLAQFGFKAITTTLHLVATVRSEPEYGVTITVPDVPQTLAFTEVTTTFWGVPADESHDEYRVGPNDNEETCLTIFGPDGAECPSRPDKILPFLTNPSACAPSSVALGHVDSWAATGSFANVSAGNLNGSGQPIGISGCGAVDFSPTLEARPTTSHADSPAGLNLDLHLPQNQDPKGLAEAQLRDASLTFPSGMTINPASAAGLEACSPAQVGLSTPVGQPEAHFDGATVSCPDSSRLGSVELVTPVLDNPLQGNIYLATQNENPFNSLLALYIVVEDPKTGVIIKLAGHPVPDPQTGRLTVSFDQNPQLPFEDLKVSLFPGERGSLRTPMACGDFTTTSDLTPWTSPEGADKQPSASFAITEGAGNSACLKSEAEAPNRPSFSAGTTDPTAGAFSPFVLKLARADGTQPLKAIDATLPKGLLGRLAGIPYCPDAALAASAARSGRSEQASPSCPAASQVGTVAVGAGAGTTPLYVSGKAYLAGPYKGAPLSLAIVTPAVAGPFDLGDVVVRTALQVDPQTTQIHAVSDPIPTILQGIPLDIRSIALTLDRPGFTLNPTSCEPSATYAGATSVFDQTAALSDPFQVGGCESLGFRPRLSLDLAGGTRRSDHPALTATLRTRAGDANIARAVVALPHSEFLAQNHIRTVCTRVQFAADACPKASIYGHATAISPLLDQPLSGPVYLRSSSHKLPDLVADLNGQIRIDLVGRIDSFKGGIRNTFELVPDAPVSKFVLELQGGRKGLLENSRNLCKATNRATVRLNGQNGKIHDFAAPIGNDCQAGRSKVGGGRKKRR